MAEIKEVVEKITEFIAASPTQTLLGVRLGIKLRESVPNFSPVEYDCRNLRQFVARYVPRVKEIGRSGADITYAVSDGTPVDDTPATATPMAGPLPKSTFIELPVDSRVWKAFTNPSYPYRAAVNSLTGEFSSLPSAQEHLAPWVVLDKCTSDLHLQLAKEFVGSLGEPNRSHLLRVLDDPKWFARFFGILQHIGLASSWGLFKRERLVQRFYSAVKDAGVSVLGREPSSAPLPRTPRPQASRSPDLDEEVRFRRLVSRLVEELPIAEIRALRLPVGDVFDALTKGR